MVDSPVHGFGQAINSLLQGVVQAPLAHFCERHSFYLDCQAQKRAVRRDRNLSWEDSYGNRHDLDFVFEQDGSDHKYGLPVAFFKVACRCHPRHPADKAEEIQQTISLLAERYQWNSPFFGIVLAGEFTSALMKLPRMRNFAEWRI